MPELPEVETMCRGIAAIVGRRVLGVERPECRKRPISIRPRPDVFRRRAVGKTVAAIERVGKRVVIWLGAKVRAPNVEGTEAIVIEPRMTGMVLLADPPTKEHLRFRMRLSGDINLLFWDRRGLGTVRLFSREEFDAQFHGEKKSVGPDALALSANQLREQLHHSRRAIKVALMDQRALAGIGNLYASEILHLAGVRPAKRANRLRRDDWQRLHAAMLDVLEAAIRYEGSTLSDGTYRNAQNRSGAYQNHHRVYDRAGKPCPSCGKGPIRRIVQAQRSTYFCPNCQR